MIKLDTITRSLQIVLTAAKTTTDMPVVVSYAERTGTANTTTEGTQLASSNGVTAVTICAAPISSTLVRSVEHISVYNADTASKVVAINLLDTATSYTLIKCTLLVGDELVYTTNAGWEVIDSTGAVRMSYPSSIDSPAFTGTPTAPTAAVGTNTTQIATTAFVLANRGKAVAQVVTSASGAVATGTTVLPVDDTIPQITEGDQYLSLAITPQSATSLLEIDVECHLSSSIVTNICAALFQDATANALSATYHYEAAAGGIFPLVIKYIMTSGTTSATTFRVRGGGGGAGTTTFNGSGGGRLFGGVLASRITIKEYLP